jgi:quercetin dioxygenase-like cupin family protein
MACIFSKSHQRDRMKSINIMLLFVLTITFPVTGFCLDPSSSVSVEKLLSTQSSWDGTALVYPKGLPEITSLQIDIAPGAETGWHLHPVPSLAYVLQGELEVQLKDGQVKRVNAGDSFTEVVNTLHNGRNVGKLPVKLVVFYIGEVGQTLTIKDAVK